MPDGTGDTAAIGDRLAKLELEHQARVGALERENREMRRRLHSVARAVEILTGHTEESPSGDELAARRLQRAGHPGAAARSARLP